MYQYKRAPERQRDDFWRKNMAKIRMTTLRIPYGGRTNARLERRMTCIFMFALASIFMFSNLLSSNRPTGRRNENARAYAMDPNGTTLQHAPKPRTRKSRWYQLFPLTQLQEGVSQWELKPDPHEFAYIHNTKYKCNNYNLKSPDILLVIFVNSAPDHRLKRQYIRQTFGNSSAWPFENGSSVMRIVFLIGAVDDPNVQDDIHFESLIYDDIVQEAFTDNYLNMTRKTIMGMKWVTKFCRNAKFTMKVDDDVLINTPLVYDILRRSPTTNFSLGFVHQKAPPFRSPRGAAGKYYTPKHVYPDKFYPPYLNGHAYIMSTDVAEKVYLVSRELNFFPWSDVFVGMCMNKLKIRPRHTQLFYSEGFRRRNKTTFALDGNALDIMREFISVYHYTVGDMDQLWDVWMRKEY